MASLGYKIADTYLIYKTPKVDANPLKQHRWTILFFVRSGRLIGVHFNGPRHDPPQKQRLSAVKAKGLKELLASAPLEGIDLTRKRDRALIR